MLYYCLLILFLNACAWYFYHRTRAVPDVPPPIENEPPPDSVPQYVTEELFRTTLKRLHELLSKNLQEMHEYNEQSFAILGTILDKALSPQHQPIKQGKHGIGFQPQNINKKKSKTK